MAITWGGYFSQAAGPQLSVAELTMENTLNLYLYGQVVKPTDPSERIRDPGAGIPTVTVNMQQYMQSAGTLMKPAFAAEYQLFKDFFNGTLDSYIAANGGSVTLAQLQTQGYSKSFTYQHVDYEGRPLWQSETFIWNSCTWNVDPSATFTVAGGGARSIGSLKFVREDDNYDYETATWLASQVSKESHSY
jgi:hypothetical protein